MQTFVINLFLFMWVKAYEQHVQEALALLIEAEPSNAKL